MRPRTGPVLVTALVLAACEGASPPPPAPAAVVRPAARVDLPPPGSACAVARTAPGVTAPGFESTTDPLERVLSRARASGRPALVYLSATWCGWCSRLTRETLPDPRVQARLRDFVAVVYDADTAAGRAVAKRYGVRGFPAILALDASGEVRAEVAGHLEPDALLARLGGV